MLRSFKEIMWMVQVSFLLALPLKLVIGFHEPTMVVRGIGCGTTREYTVWTDVIPDAKYPPCALLKSREAREAYKDVIPLWFEATPWTDCSKTCGVGDQTRTRKCQTRTGQSLLPEDCHNTGITLQGRKCNVFKCTSLTPWSEWSSCVGTCGPVLRSRNRSCQEMDTQINYPKDYCHGANLTDYEDCELDPCPKDGGWSAWNAETCPGTCGGFVVNRTRTCDNPAPLSGGLPCPGLAIETIPCGTDPCPIDGAWTEWTPWSLCPVTCGGANETRTRTCSNPAPQFDGAACPDASSNEIQECNTKACPVDGGWAEWSSNSDCSATCGGGSSVKNRFCINPPPSNGGEDCSGNDTEVMSCNENHCPIPGEWNSWSPWGMCTGPVCGTGSKTRTRDCGVALHGGLQICTLASVENDVDSCDICTAASPSKISDIVAPTSLSDPYALGFLYMSICSSDDLCCSLGNIGSDVNVGTTVLTGGDLGECEDKCFTDCQHPIMVKVTSSGVLSAPKWTTTSFLIVFRNNASVQCPGVVVSRFGSETALCALP